MLIVAGRLGPGGGASLEPVAARTAESTLKHDGSQGFDASVPPCCKFRAFAQQLLTYSRTCAIHPEGRARWRDEGRRPQPSKGRCRACRSAGCKRLRTCDMLRQRGEALSASARRRRTFSAHGAVGMGLVRVSIVWFRSVADWGGGRSVAIAMHTAMRLPRVCFPFGSSLSSHRILSTRRFSARPVSACLRAWRA